MNANDIYSAAALLNSEKTLENKEQFYSALNRAVAEVSRIRPIYNRVTIVNFTLPVAARLDGEPRQYGIGKSFTLFGSEVACIYVATVGSGTLTVKYGTTTLDTVTLPGGRKQSEYKKVVSAIHTEARADITVTITSTTAGVVTAAVLYKDKISDVAEDVPDAGECNRYDVTAYANDVGEVERVYFNSNRGELILPDTKIESKRYVIIPKAHTGAYTVEYRTKLSEITEDTADTKINIRPELNELVPLLVGYYVWLDDDDTKAAAFYDLYSTGVARLKTEPAEQNGLERIVDRYGW